MQDEAYRHHPDATDTQDRAGNVRHTTGGNTVYNVVDDFQRDTSWDVLNSWTQDTSWNILNDFDQDTSWDIINTFTQAISWAILNEWSVDTSWHIHPAVIKYIQLFLINSIKTEFDLKVKIPTSFAVCPIDTAFNVNSELTSAVKLKAVTDVDRTFKMKQKIKTSFDLRQPIQKSFKITRILGNTRNWR